MLTDRYVVFLAAGLRSSAVALSGLILALHLSFLGLNAWTIGLAVSFGLAGCAIGTAIVAYVADYLGRRATLVVLALLMALGGLAFSLATAPSVLLASALVGMVNGMGRDRGAGMTVDQAILPQTTTADRRTGVFAWYNLVVDGGHAAGSLLGVLPALLRAHGMAPLASYQWAWRGYSALCLCAGLLALRLSAKVESRLAPSLGRGAGRLSPTTRPIVAKFAALSGLDSLGGGFLTTALLSFWFFKRFGVDESLLAPLFCIVRIANGLSHLAAAWCARRIGLIRTMVFTHLPSSLLLMTVPLAPNLPVAIALFLVRESLVEMDVPTRQSYIVAVVREEERTRAAGVANLTRSAAWAVAPFAAGALMRVSLGAPLVVGAGLKVVYDLCLYRAFRHLKPPEEQIARRP